MNMTVWSSTVDQAWQSVGVYSVAWRAGQSFGAHSIARREGLVEPSTSSYELKVVDVPAGGGVYERGTLLRAYAEQVGCNCQSKGRVETSREGSSMSIKHEEFVRCSCLW
jgi:hypothetical protein